MDEPTTITVRAYYYTDNYFEPHVYLIIWVNDKMVFSNSDLYLPFGKYDYMTEAKRQLILNDSLPFFIGDLADYCRENSIQLYNSATKTNKQDCIDLYETIRRIYQ